MTREEMLKTATEIVTKNRQDQYGKPEHVFGEIQRLWSAYLHMKLSEADVCNLMILLKMARSKDHEDYTDNWVDIAGYAACACEMFTEPGEEYAIR